MAGKCPECGRVVPVPPLGCGTLNSPKGKKPRGNDPESRTEDLDPAELAELEKWSGRYLTKSGQAEGPLSTTGIIAVNSRAENDNNIGLPINAFVQASVVKFETGLRVCPRCKKPLHLTRIIVVSVGCQSPASELHQPMPLEAKQSIIAGLIRKWRG